MAASSPEMSGPGPVEADHAARMEAGRTPSGRHLDLDRTRELFDSSTDFTIGLEEEFAIVDPESSSSRTASSDLYAACRDDDLLAEAAAGELIATEIEIRSGKAASFAEAVERQRERRARLFGLADGHGTCAGGDRHPPVGELPRSADHRHPALRAAPRRAPVGRSAKQHLEPSRPRRRARAPTARSPCATAFEACCRPCSRCRPTRPSWTAATRASHSVRTRDLHQDLPALRRARAVRRLGRLRGLR